MPIGGEKGGRRGEGQAAPSQPLPWGALCPPPLPLALSCILASCGVGRDGPESCFVFLQSSSASGGSSRGRGVEGQRASVGKERSRRLRDLPRVQAVESWRRDVGWGGPAPSRMDGQPWRKGHSNFLLSPDFSASRGRRSGRGRRGWTEGPTQPGQWVPTDDDRPPG